MWVAKAIFKNTGESNIHNLKVSYKLGQYSDWSIPKTYSLIVPGGCVVDLYYPVISSKVTELLTRTPVDVRIKYEYRDEEGNAYSDVSGERIEILGINQMEFCNLTMEEITGTWAEYFSNSPLLAAWVTHLDPPVKALAGMVSRLAGGVPTALDRESAIKFCRALYDLEVANGMVYQTPSGFLVEYSPGQDVKYPRDVLRDKSGTCVDLAILYASVCEAVGLGTILVDIPGHCFPVIILPGGELLPVECTAISGVAVGKPEVKSLSFDKAVELASKEVSELKMGQYYIVNVKEMQQKGLVSPELPRLEGDILERWGWRLPQVQVQQTREGEVEERGEEGQPTATKKYSSEQSKFSFDYPQGWKVEEKQGAVNVIHPQTLAFMTMWRITQDVDPQTHLQNVESQLKQQYKNFTITSRKQIVINGVDAIRVDAQSTAPQGAPLRHILLVLYQNNLAKVMVVCDALKEQYANLSPTLEQILGSITLIDEERAQALPQTSQQTRQPPETGQTSKVTGWFRYQMSELLPINNAMAVTYIEYPKDWQVIPDYYQRRVTFSKDSTGTISFTLCPLTELMNPPQRTASEFFQLLFQEINQKASDLKIVKQDFPQFQNIAGTIVSEGRVELQGTENGMAMTYYTWINYFYSSGGYFSMGSAIFAIGQAPTSRFANINMHIFGHMVKTFVDSFPKAQPKKDNK